MPDFHMHESETADETQLTPRLRADDMKARGSHHRFVYNERPGAGIKKAFWIVGTQEVRRSTAKLVQVGPCDGTCKGC